MKNSDTSIPKPLVGFFHYIEDEEYDDARKFQRELLSIKKDDYNRDQIKGSVRKNIPHPNRKLVFDITGDEDYWPSTFIGFLYPGRKVLGTIKYIKDANLPEEKFVGKYFVTKTGRIISFGRVYYADQTFYSVCIELMPDRKR